MMNEIAEDVWIQRFPMSLLGADIGRNVMCVRMSDGKVVVHSTAPFSEGDVKAIRGLGEVALVVDATGFHDTYLDRGAAAFSEARLLVPRPLLDGGGRREFLEPAVLQDLTGGELEVAKLEGMPAVDEHLVYHGASRTLVAADLFFNLGERASGWTGFLMKVMSGIDGEPGMSRMFKLMIKDRVAFSASLGRALEWDFDRIVVGHGEVIEDAGAFRKLVAPYAGNG